MGALFTTVALMNTSTTLATTAGTLIAAQIGPAAWSGLPSAASVFGTAVGALLAGRLTARRGRRHALLTGYSLGAVGALIAFAGAATSSLALLLLGQAMLGVGNGAAQLSRYLAADLYPLERKGFALSAVIWAGTVGALTGPLLIAPAASVAQSLGLVDLSGPTLFAAIAVAAAALAAFLLPPDEAPEQRPTEGWAVFRKPQLRLPLAAMIVGQVVMVGVMTMTPPQLHHLGHSLDTVGWILSAHIFGMFALSPLTGRFADRFGGRVTIACGIVVLAIATGLAFAYPESHTSGLPISLFLLGYGWNLMFVGGSSLLSRILPTGSQGAVDAVVWGSSVFGSVGAGQLFGYGGYSLVAAVAGVLAVLPVFAFASRRPKSGTS
ncbi:putative MFS family arabinose efflux permease [Actinocrispum wychmicini]|uniref:Putative MFS family arabinose efflux permease n=2 Tax=Actinocrispum wychmicini TaxID=1213861 RepID=A0A4V2S6V1_9PSEU|nr:putative MFS family arabinose efflux permease [Actinocrispum wychmicini]